MELLVVRNTAPEITTVDALMRTNGVADTRQKLGKFIFQFVFLGSFAYDGFLFAVMFLLLRCSEFLHFFVQFFFEHFFLLCIHAGHECFEGE